MAKKVNSKMMKRKRRRRVLFIFEILILLILVGGIFVYAQVNNKLNKIQSGDVDMGEVGSTKASWTMRYSRVIRRSHWSGWTRAVSVLWNRATAIP